MTCHLQQIHFINKDTDWQGRYEKKVFHENENQKHTGVTTHLSYKIDFKKKNHRKKSITMYGLKDQFNNMIK